MITACDIRIGTKDSRYTIKEVDIGIVADLGTTQRLPLISANDSLLRELAYTGRWFNAEEALKFGLISKICENKDDLDRNLMKMAEEIASKSPVVIWGLKKVLN
mmetsp:Transcript_106096/g.158730  ORF Transcript_106096/g.158730 Transcript_106096/m.158730 type:complete len:104 (+) Transcript_106096:434-745(+)